MNTLSEHEITRKVLVMEDEANVARALQMILTEEGFEVDVEMTGNGALERFGRNHFDLLIADLRLPDIDGMEVIRKVKSEQPETEVVVITGYSTVASAVEAMKLGAFDYLSKPFTDDEIRKMAVSALKIKQEGPARESDEGIEGPRVGVLIQKREVLNVLNRTTTDRQFWKDLMELGSEALDEYPLKSEAKAAIISGDLQWLNENVGELTQKQLMFVYKRGEREAW